jgi:hypothetical protein
MAKAKSWGDKLRCGKASKVAVLEKPFAGLPIGTRLYVPSPQKVATAVSVLPPGTMMTVKEFRSKLAEDEQLDAACPIATAMALRIVAEATLEEIAQGAKQTKVTPFWRAMSVDDTLAGKLSCGADGLAKLQREDRHK